MQPDESAPPLEPAVVYADRCVVAVNKPPGVSLATPRSDPQAAVVRLIGSLSRTEIDRFTLDTGSLRLVHRLDTGTTGLVLLARDPDTHRELVRLLRSRQIRKTYLALVWGHLRPREGEFRDPIGPDRRDRRRMRVDPAGRSAVSRYRTRAAARYTSLLELNPLTGRTHQLRVHLSRSGHWIVGDDLYSGPRHHAVREPALRRALNPSHPLLHAWHLAVPAVGTSPAIELEAPLPPAFRAALDALGIPSLEDKP